MLPEKFCGLVPPEGESIFNSTRADYKIVSQTGCWEWLKGRTPSGYPQRYAHRLYYEAANQTKVPKGWHTHHLCRNKACVNRVTPWVIENIWRYADWVGVGNSTRPVRQCQFCGGKVPDERKRHAIYCDSVCRVRANRAKRWTPNPARWTAKGTSR